MVAEARPLPGVESSWNSDARAATRVAEAFAQTARAAEEAGPGQLAAAEGLWARGAREEAAVEDLEEDARLGAENAQLRQENAQLALEEAQLRAEGERLRGEDSRLRAEGEKLRSEDVGLRHALTAASTLATWTRRNATAATRSSQQAHTQKVKPAVAIVCGFSVVVFVGYIVFCTSCFGDAEDADTTDSDSDDFWARGKGARKQEQRLRDMIDGGRSRDTCFGCCFSKALCYFTAGVAVVSGAAGIILWEMGILQPVLGNLFMYAYVIVLLASFVSLLLCEVWRVARKLLKYVLDQLQAFNSAFKTFGLKAKYKCNDFMDDGKLNASFPKDKEDAEAEGDGGHTPGSIFTFDWIFEGGEPPPPTAQARTKRNRGGERLGRRWRP